MRFLPTLRWGTFPACITFPTVSAILVPVFGHFVTGAFFFDVVFAFGVGRLMEEFGVVFLKSIRDVLEEDQTEDNVFIFGGGHMAAQFVGDGPKRGLKAEMGVIFGAGGGAFTLGIFFSKNKKPNKTFVWRGGSSPKSA